MTNYQYYHNMNKIYEKIITQSGRNFEELTLEVSYRSASSILKFTDYIFNKNVVLGEARSIAHQVILVIRSRVLPVVDFTNLTQPTRLH